MKDANSRTADLGDPTYEPPTVLRLGTLTELTLGGGPSEDDAMAGAGSTPS